MKEVELNNFVFVLIYFLNLLFNFDLNALNCIISLKLDLLCLS